MPLTELRKTYPVPDGLEYMRGVMCVAYTLPKDLFDKPQVWSAAEFGKVCKALAATGYKYAGNVVITPKLDASKWVQTPSEYYPPELYISSEASFDLEYLNDILIPCNKQRK